MNTTKEPSPFARLWVWAADYHSGFYGAVALAVLGVACHMLAYVCIAVMIRLLLSGGGLRECLPWCGVLLAGYGGKALFSAMSTSASHTATYYTLRDLRKSLLSKLSRVPMGTILNTLSGQYKTTIVDRVEGMEPTLAHLLPEMTVNALVPLFLAVYIFVLDWRMRLASLVTTVIGLITASQSGRTYAVRWQGAVEVGRRMANAIVEYIGGIQVVKAFSQSAGSYRKYSKAVEDNAQYYVDWIRICAKSRWNSSTARSPMSPRTITCLTVLFGIISVWASWMPPMKKWKRRHQRRAATNLSGHFLRAMIRSAAAVADTSPVVRNSASPLLGRC